MNQNISTSFLVSASAGKVIEAINNVAGWWATNVAGDTKKVGDCFTVRFGKTYSVIEVIELIPEKKLVWSVIDCDLPLFRDPKEWFHTSIVWELEIINDTTKVLMTHEGLTPDKSCYEDCKKGWRYYVCESLRRLIIEGKGMPGTGIFCYVVIDGRRYEGLLYFKNDPLPDYPPGFIYADVLTTKGEEVVEIDSSGEYDIGHFNARRLCGDYYMILENKPIYQNLVPLQEIMQFQKYV